jgi:bifunctional enzyme CysN/CysC
MVTGASTADLALVLIDARKGMTEQSHRHAVIASLLQVRHLVVCVNKMDLVDYSEEVFESIRAEFSAFAAKLDVTDVVFVPLSALHGDNVITHSPNTPWYGGPTLIWHLENVYIASDRNLIDPRFPVQYVIRPMSHEFHDYRGYAGEVAGGAFRPGDEVLVLPSGFTTTVASVEMAGEPVAEGVPPMSATLRLTDAIDISRGDMICRVGNSPTVSQDVEATVCWFSEAPLTERARLEVRHTTRTARALVSRLHYRLDVNTLHRDEDARVLNLNDIGRVTLRTAQPLMFDSYRRNRRTGSFILVDEQTNATVGAGMILGESE